MSMTQSAREARKIGGVLVVMDEKAKAARRAYKNEWAKRNPDKVRAQQERYWMKRATEMEHRDAGAVAQPERRSAGNG